jgi:hypothetical protein
MLENINHSYIVRIWLEPREIEGANIEWKGSVQHVTSGERKYFTTFAQLNAFIAKCAALDVPELAPEEP